MDLLNCAGTKCKDDFSAVFRESMSIYSKEIFPLKAAMDTKKKEFEQGKIKEAAYNKFTQVTKKKIDALMIKMIKSETTMKHQLCSVKECQSENKKNLKAIQDLYAALCKKNHQACNVNKLATTLTKKDKLTGKDMVAVVLAEHKAKSSMGL